MKKIFVLATMMVAMVCGTYAQDSEEWYMIVNKSGASDKYVVADVDEVSVTFAKGVDSWVEYAVGTPTYGGFFSSSTSGIYAGEMTLYRSSLVPNEFKIADWEGYTDLYFTYDETTGKVVNAPYDTGIYSTRDGYNYYGDDQQHYWLINGSTPSNDLASKWDGDKIYLAIYYYVNDSNMWGGAFGYWYAGDESEYDIFTISEYK